MKDFNVTIENVTANTSMIEEDVLRMNMGLESKEQTDNRKDKDKVVELINQIGNSLDAPAYAERLLTECGKEILNIVKDLEGQREYFKNKLKYLKDLAQSVRDNEDSVFADERSVAEYDTREIIDILLGLELSERRTQMIFKTIGTDIYYSIDDGRHWFWYVNMECC